MTYNPANDATAAALANKQDIGSRTVTAATTITDADSTIYFNSPSNLSQPLPAAASVTKDKAFYLKNINTGIVTISSVLDGVTGKTLAQNASFTVASDGAAWWIK